MKKEIESNFYFDNYIIKEINLEFNQKFNSEDPVDLDFDLNIYTDINSEQKEGWTELDILIWDKAEENNYPFTLKLKIVGFFSADSTMEEEEFSIMCKYNGASILFPFLRSAAADVTKAANITSLTLPLINVKKFIDDEDKE